MPALATANETLIQDAMVTAVEGLNLTLNTVPVPVAKRKVPRRGETVDPVPQIVVVQLGKPPPPVLASFEGDLTYRYTEAVIIIAANNEDNLTNLATYQQWYESIRRLFQQPLAVAGIAGKVTWTMTNPERLIDPREVAEGYDYLSLGVTVTVWESAV
jgi:hypothetical protein